MSKLQPPASPPAPQPHHSIASRQAGTLQPQAGVPQRILIIGPSNIGDAILTSGAIAALSATYPTAHLTLVVGERATVLFAEDPRIHTLMDTSRFDTALGRLKLFVTFWRYQPQVILDLRHTLYPVLLKPRHLWRYLRQPPTTMKHMRERHAWKLRTQVPEAAVALPRVERTALWSSPRDVAHVDALTRRWGLNGTQRTVVICPGARSHIKRWLSEGFARVADRLIEACRVEVIFSGEPEEESIIEESLGLMHHKARSGVGLTTIRQLGVLMQRASLVITNDSASLHLASAVDAPTLAIFGPTDAAKYGPTSSRHRVIRRHLFCTPCEQALCQFSYECMRFVSADEVYRAACELLDVGRKKLEVRKI